LPSSPGESGLIDLVSDVDILELTWSAASGVGAARVPAAKVEQVDVTAGSVPLPRVSLRTSTA